MVGTGTYLTSLTGANVNGTVATANVALYEQVTALTNNQTYYPMFSNVSASGNTIAGVNSSLSYNPSTGTLTATTFSGTVAATNISGTVATANVSLYDSFTATTTNATFYPQLVDKTTGNGATFTASTLSHNPSTGALTATSFNGIGTFSTATTSSTFIASGNIVAASATASTSATTGALIVAGTGGMGVGGNTFLGGAVTLNSSQTAGNDVIVKGKNDGTLIWARPNATYDTVIIGNSAVAGNVVNGAKLNVYTTDSILLPVGTSAQRPGSVGFTDVTGMFRYSTTQGAIEWYNGTQWASASTSFTVIADQQFTGTGSQTVFTLSSTQTTASCIVSINGVVQIPTLAYSVSGTTLTFTEAPANGEVIDVRMLTTTSTVTQLYDTSGYNTVNATTGTGITFTAGTTTNTTQYTIDTRGAMVTNGANVTVASASTATIDTLFANAYSSAKYTITATLSGTNIREITEVLMVHNGDGTGAGTATVSTYGRVNTAGNTLATYGATVSGNIAVLQATTTNANTIFRIKKDYQAI